MTVKIEGSSSLVQERHIWQRYQECLSNSQTMHQIRFRPGLRPGPRSGSSRRSPRPPSRLGRTPPLGAFGASSLRSPFLIFKTWQLWTTHSLIRIWEATRKFEDVMLCQKPLARVVVSASHDHSPYYAAHWDANTIACRVVMRLASTEKKTSYASIRSIQQVRQTSFNFWACPDSTRSSKAWRFAENEKISIFHSLCPGRFLLLGCHTSSSTMPLSDTQMAIHVTYLRRHHSIKHGDVCVKWCK